MSGTANRAVSEIENRHGKENDIYKRLTFVDEQAFIYIYITYTSISAIYKHIHTLRKKSNGNKNNKKHFQ